MQRVTGKQQGAQQCAAEHRAKHGLAGDLVEEALVLRIVLSLESIVQSRSLSWTRTMHLP
jgi:hypothetical protein